MGRRRGDKPIEALRTAWTSTADLEETLAGMFGPQRSIEITPVETSPVETTGVQGHPNESTPVDSSGDAELVATPVETIRRVSTPVRSIEVEPSGDVSTGHVFTPVASTVFLPAVKKRLFRPHRAAEAHTDGEERLYRFLWENGKEHSPWVRIYAGSMSTLAQAMGRDDRNTRPVVESLIRKLAIQVARQQDFASKQPRVYYVFHPSEIVARRSQAGLVWAVKNKGIQLVSEEDARQLSASRVHREPPTDPGEATDLTPVNTVLRA